MSALISDCASVADTIDFLPQTVGANASLTGMLTLAPECLPSDVAADITQFANWLNVEIRRRLENAGVKAGTSGWSEASCRQLTRRILVAALKSSANAFADGKATSVTRLDLAELHRAIDGELSLLDRFHRVDAPQTMDRLAGATSSANAGEQVMLASAVRQDELCVVPKVPHQTMVRTPLPRLHVLLRWTACFDWANRQLQLLISKLVPWIASDSPRGV